MSSSATPASAATRSTTALEATAAAGALIATAALKTAAPAGELLTTRGTPLGKSSGLSPIAGIEGGALSGKVAAPGGTAKLRRAKIGALS